MTCRASQALKGGRAAAAFVLIEMIITLGLFTIFSFVAFRLVSTTLRIGSEVNRAEIVHLSFDDALANLRRDVWSAVAVDVRGPGGVTISLGDSGDSATWTVAADGSLVRTAGPIGAYPERRSWAAAGEGAAFGSDPAGLVLELRRRGHDSGTYHLFSQLLLASERK
jgi:hypothetical protein